MDNTELAWAAGFLDGEGTFDFSVNKNGYCVFRIQASQVHREPLDRLQVLLGGKVYGPYGPYQGNRKAYYLWHATGKVGIAASKRLTPYLCSVKIAQCSKAIERANS